MLVKILAAIWWDKCAQFRTVLKKTAEINDSNNMGAAKLYHRIFSDGAILRTLFIYLFHTLLYSFWCFDICAFLTKF